MTLVVGLKCDDDSVVVCSDSQATSPFHKSFYAKKSYLISGASPACILAGSGDPGYISEAARAIIAAEEELSISSIEKSVGGIYDRFIRKEVSAGRAELGYDLVVAIREESTELYHVYENGRSEKLEKGWPGYVSIGSGSLWSEWLLKPFRQFFTDSNVGLQFAVYAIEAVKEVDPNVGGEIQAGRIWPTKKGWGATTPPDSKLRRLSGEVKNRRDLLDQCWAIFAHDANFEQVVKERVEEYLKPEVGEE